MGANGKSRIAKAERGFIKILASTETGEVLGAQLMCPRASDIAGELTVAVSNHLIVPQLLTAIRAHPTYNEGIGEALEELDGAPTMPYPKRTDEVRLVQKF